MKSLVTGATGFLGEALVRDLVGVHGPDAVTVLLRDPLPEAEREAAGRIAALGVRVVPSDLLALPALDAASIEFEVIYHLAAETDSGASADRLRINHQGLRHLLETLGPERMAGKRVVLAGATAAIDRGRRPTTLMKETDPEHPRTEYGRSKLRAEKDLALYAERWGFTFAVPRFSPVWTPELSIGFLKAFREQVQNRSILRRIRWPGRVTMIRREDAVAILRHFGETGAADGRAVHVGDGRVYPYADLIRDLRRLSFDSGWSLPIPGFLWSLLRFMIWLPVAKSKCPWRVSCLLGDDLAVDASLLKSLYPAPLKSWPESLEEIRV